MRFWNAPQYAKHQFHSYEHFSNRTEKHFILFYEKHKELMQYPCYE